MVRLTTITTNSKMPQRYSLSYALTCAVGNIRGSGASKEIDTYERLMLYGKKRL
jgi:hypothetical protein